LKTFHEKVKHWSEDASAKDAPNWEEQIRLLSEIGELITPELKLEEVISTIYVSVNQLMDADQFAVGLYDPEEEVIHFKGMIEGNMQLPDVIVDAREEDRWGTWCIRNDAEIFVNDIEAEYSKYIKKIPYPKAGYSPNAALYVPLRLNDKVAGLICVRTFRKNVYQKHHLYILKTLGNFVIRSWALSQERSKPSVQLSNSQKNWRWNETDQLAQKSKKLLAELTEREKEVLFLMVSGLSNKAIAEKLFVSPGTIKTHTLNIYQKMEVNNRTAATIKAIELSWFV
jgi:DNA-binding CsgD family transcriptional regulator